MDVDNLEVIGWPNSLVDDVGCDSWDGTRIRFCEENVLSELDDGFILDSDISGDGRIRVGIGEKIALDII